MRLELGNAPRSDAWVMTPYHAAQLRGSDCTHTTPCPCILDAVFSRLTLAVAGFRSLGDRLLKPSMLEFAVDWNATLEEAARRCRVGPVDFARTRNGRGRLRPVILRRIRTLSALLAIEKGLYPIESYFGEQSPEPVVFAPILLDQHHGDRVPF